ncbi:MAG: fibronectin type III domain-containing protein [Thermoplasmata archaeon]|nr:fibronectin type III domain-containing protein [Thermoplasmata archaeon]
MREPIVRIMILMMIVAFGLSIVPAPVMAAEVPGVPTALAVTSDDGAVTLTWSTPSDDGGSDITGYRVYRGIMADGLGIVEDVTVMLYTDNGLQNGQTYYYAVSALNAEGEGQKTEIFPATPEAGSPLMTSIVVADYKTYVIINVGEGVYFDIAGGTHSVVVESITGTSALITISSDPQSFTMSEGDAETVDVDGDGTDDFAITCETITSETADGFPQTVKFSFTKDLGGSGGGGTPGFELWGSGWSCGLQRGQYI